MSQILQTKYYGALEFEMTWGEHNGIHVGRLTNGAYAHTGGQPIASVAELQRVIPRGDDLNDAMDWWEHKDERAAKAALAPQRLVMFYPPDGTWRYVDTQTIVDKAADLYEALKGSDALESALAWFFSREKTRPDGDAALTPASGYGPDERCLSALGHAGEDGLTIHELGSQLKIDPKAMTELTRTMRESGRISRHGKRFYLPDKAPTLNTGTEGDGEE